MYVNFLSCLLRLTPERPKKGVKADFEHRQFLGHQVLITGCISLAILFIFLIVRTYAKIFIFKKITTDDCKSESKCEMYYARR